MPITNFKLVGQWGPEAKRAYGYSKQDTGILENPKAVEKIHKLWSNSKNDFELIFLRSKEAYKKRELGEKSSSWIKENLGIDVEPKDDKITIIFTQNFGAEKIPMTAWAIAHRLGHAIKNDKVFEIYFGKEVKKDFIDILKEVYKRGELIGKFRSYGYSDPTATQDKDLLALATAVGTMKSARERNLRNFYEFIYELVAQYITTGKIRFNPLPKGLIVQKRMAWGRPNDKQTFSPLNDAELKEYDNILDGHAQKYEYYLDSVFSGLEGKIFVM